MHARNVLVEIHDFETFGTQDSDSSLEEYEVERLRGQEKVAIDAEPV